MILKNKKGIERNFRVLFEIDNKNQKYIVYEDVNTLNIYGGKLSKNIMKSLNDDEIKLLNNMINRLVGEK